MASTMTINVDEAVAREFRRIAASVYGKGKGHLGKAVQEALDFWVSVHKKKSADEQLMEMLKKGFGAGGINYKSRDELHDRN